MGDSQTELSSFVSEVPTDTVSIARTVKCKLKTSKTKNETVQRAINDWQYVAREMADYMPSFGRHRWGQRDTGMTRLARREFTDIDIYAHDRNEAVNKVREAFDSWESNGRVGPHPRGQFGDGNYMRLCSCCDRLDIRQNERGFGVQLKLVKGADPIWFHIDSGAYQDDYLAGIVQDEYQTGDAEVHLTETGDVYLHLSVTRDIEVYKPQEVPRLVGVDVGERVLYATAAIEASDEEGWDNPVIHSVELESGREFRHHRERLKQQRSRLQQQGDLQGVRDVRGEHERYTEHVLGTASREIIDFAEEHAPCAIVLEDMTHYRETADDPIHDFPYADLQEKIAYKATDAGISVVTVNPAGTSTTCRQCGQRDPEYRDGTEFACRRCGYEVHADVNAAINIARKRHTGIISADFGEPGSTD